MTTQKQNEKNEELEAAKAVIRAAVEVATALADIIQFATHTNGGIPSGHLYASVMGHLSLERYQQFIKTLVDLKLVEDRNHFLVWVGPEKEAQ